MNLIGSGDIAAAQAACAEAQRLSPAWVKHCLAGRIVYRKPEHVRRATTFLRIAAGLEDPRCGGAALSAIVGELVPATTFLPALSYCDHRTVGHGMQSIDITLAARGQIVIPKEARDALGLKPGARLRLRVEGGRLLIEKRVQLDLSRWIGKALPDGLTTEQALAELRGRPVPWPGDAAHAKPAAAVARPARPKKAPRK